jgi:hypothetical protein
MLFLKHNFEKVKLSVLNKKEIQIKKKKNVQTRRV